MPPGCSPVHPSCNPVHPSCSPVPPGCSPVHPSCSPVHPMLRRGVPGAAARAPACRAPSRRAPTRAATRRARCTRWRSRCTSGCSTHPCARSTPRRRTWLRLKRSLVLGQRGGKLVPFRVVHRGQAPSRAPARGSLQWQTRTCSEVSRSYRASPSLSRRSRYSWGPSEVTRQSGVRSWTVLVFCLFFIKCAGLSKILLILERLLVRRFLPGPKLDSVENALTALF